MDPARDDDVLFRVLEDREAASRDVAPTRLTGGPWNPAHQHGGPVAGLLAAGLERMPSPVPMRLARMSVDMFRAVPRTPLRVEARLVRGGRRIQSVEATIFDADTPVARAAALRVRFDPALDDLATPRPVDPALGAAPQGEVEPYRIDEGFDGPRGFMDAVDFVRGREDGPEAPAQVWTRLRCAVVEGEKTDPVVRLATLADFCSAIGNAMDHARYTSINPDLSIHVLRPPRSEWIGIRALTGRSADGIGQSQATMFDAEGPVANVQSTLLLDRR